MCEIAISQSFNDWNKKCRCWMRQQYVRCVFGVKIYSVRATRNNLIGVRLYVLRPIYYSMISKCSNFFLFLILGQTLDTSNNTIIKVRRHPGVYYAEVGLVRHL